MRTGLLTIFAVAILAALTAGSPHASETSTLNADAVQAAVSQADAEPVPAPESPTADQMAADEGESVESADTAEAPQTEGAAESDVAAGTDSAVAASPGR